MAARTFRLKDASSTINTRPADEGLDLVVSALLTVPGTAAAEEAVMMGILRLSFVEGRLGGCMRASVRVDPEKGGISEPLRNLASKDGIRYCRIQSPFFSINRNA